MPICISCSTRKNSSASGPSVLPGDLRERGVEARARPRPRSSAGRGRRAARGASARCGRTPSGRARGSGAKQPSAAPTHDATTDGRRASRARGSGGTTMPSRAPTSSPSTLKAEHPVDVPAGGLPARSSRRRMPVASARRGSAPADAAVKRAASGPSTRSPNGRSSSRAHLVAARRCIASTAASERRDAASVAARARRRRRARARCASEDAGQPEDEQQRVTSDLDLDDAAQPERCRRRAGRAPAPA